MQIIIGYSLPALIVSAVIYFIVKIFLDKEKSSMQTEIKLKNTEHILPVRLQAYERLILFLERISPENLIIRVSKPGMSAFELQTEMISTIRMEFEHNLSQQLYISTPAWELIKTAKEELIKTVNTAASQMKEGADAPILASEIFEIWTKRKSNPINIALEKLKNEVRELF